ncbi:MAG: SDR family NAD(P)-dependent oxidoreductase [Lachnospiraceae bacterium]|nr:SDR family NAD(P)-dependent oxidoreductase [Lachnospiraceae bacterium]MBQ9935964.1 SDR family NAD(P)-dependent oxidoreductase [Lachnospiraceae bacterium]
MKIAIVTGASSGMGREFVYQISKRFKSIDEIWVMARRIDRLEELSKEIENIQIKPIKCDISDEADMIRFKMLLIQEKPEVRVLVNSAGYGIIGHFSEVGDDNVGMCKVNCVALTRMIDLVLPYMTCSRGNIFNLASSAAFLPQPSFSTYAASKSYVLSLSRALNKELKSRNISVTAVCPGPVKTEFFDVAEKYNTVKLYKKLSMAKADKVVELALKDGFHGKAVSVYGVLMKSFRVVSKIIPHEFMLKFFS